MTTFQFLTIVNLLVAICGHMTGSKYAMWSELLAIGFLVMTIFERD